ncbi:transcriptional repressor [Desulfobulbus sp.]|uniref:Fur family transcriptional regulator n=1 Tax=Desulfobulbus sp. TaxID=895 RepID=UPI00286F427C|nr:transcriptional repressor [Desulfobulbus sp.]
MDKLLRMTHQRELILDELRRGKTHPTADELYERIKKKLPRVSLATVYRNLEILSAAGLIKKLEISGRQKRFDWDPENHDHVYCIQCQRVDNITLAAPVPQVEATHTQGYRITGRRVEFSGLCPNCARQQENHQSKGEHSMSCPSCSAGKLSDNQRQVLQALANSSEACGSKELAAATGLEAKQISCQITALKNKGYVDSPVRCKYAITDQGKQALG